MSADQDLKDWLISQGQTPERAEQIATNHPDEVRASMEAWQAANAQESKPPEG